MKKITLLLFILIPAFLFAQYPTTGNKSRLGWQTTGDGLIWRGVAADTAIKPRTTANAYFQLDTVNRVLRRYIATQGSWQVVSVMPNLTPYLMKSDTTAMLLNYPSTAGYGLIDGGKTWRVDTANTTGLATKIFTNRFLLKSDTTTFLGPYIDGSGAITRIPIFTGARTIGNSNALYNSTTKRWTWDSPGTIELPMGTDAQRPASPTTSDMWYSTTSNGIEWYNGTRWAKGLESTFNAGTSGRFPRFDANGQVVNSVLSETSGVVSLVGSAPLALGQWTTAGRPAGTSGYIGWNTTLTGIDWYNGTRWATGLESTFARGTATRIPFFDPNGQVTDNAFFFRDVNGVLNNRINATTGRVFQLGNSTEPQVFEINILSGNLWRLGSPFLAGGTIENTSGNSGILIYSNRNSALKAFESYYDGSTRIIAKNTNGRYRGIEFEVERGTSFKLGSDRNLYLGNLTANDFLLFTNNTNLDLDNFERFNSKNLRLGGNLAATINNQIAASIYINPSKIKPTNSLKALVLTSGTSIDRTYINYPIVPVFGAGGYGARVTFTVVSNAITSLIIIEGGSGYTVGDVVTMSNIAGITFTITAVGAATTPTFAAIQMTWADSAKTYNLYADGTAKNYLNGNTGIKTLDPNEGLDVNDDVQIRDSLRLSQAALASKILQTDAKGWVKPLVLSGMDYIGGTLRANSIYNLLPTQDVTVTQATPDTFKLGLDGTLDALGEDRKETKYGGINPLFGQGTIGAILTVGREGYWAEKGAGTDSIQTPLSLFGGNTFRGDGFGMELALGGFRNLGTGKKYSGYAGLQWFTDYFNSSRAYVRLKDADNSGNFYYTNFRRGSVLAVSLSKYNMAYDVNQYDSPGIPKNSIIAENFLSVGGSLYPNKSFQVFNNSGIERASIDSAGVFRLATYGTGNKEAADLSKTQGNYLAGFATDGTVLDLERKRDTTIIITDASYNFGAALTTAQISRRYNTIVIYIKCTSADPSNNTVTLHVPDANLAQCEIIIHSIDDNATFRNDINFTANGAVNSLGGTISTYNLSAGEQKQLRVVNDGGFKYFFGF